MNYFEKDKKLIFFFFFFGKKIYIRNKHWKILKKCFLENFFKNATKRRKIFFENDFRQKYTFGLYI